MVIVKVFDRQCRNFFFVTIKAQVTFRSGLEHETIISFDKLGYKTQFTLKKQFTKVKVGSEREYDLEFI